MRSLVTSCVGKHKHKTMEAALVEVRNGKKREQKGSYNRKIRAYKCPFCPSYHVGHGE